MPIFDLRCTACGQERPDTFVRTSLPACESCGAQTEKVWRATPAVIDDTIDEWVENLAPTPQHFTSRSEKRLYLKMHGIEQKVRHIGVQGSDRNPHTTRWI